MRITAANGPLTDVYPVIPWYITAQWSTGAQGTFPPMVHWRKMLDRVVQFRDVMKIINAQLQIMFYILMCMYIYMSDYMYDYCI